VEDKKSRALNVADSHVSKFRLSWTPPEDADSFHASLDQDKIEDVMLEVPSDPKTDDKEDIGKKLIREMRRVVLQIANHLEKPDVFQLMTQKFDALLKMQKYGEMEFILEDLFKEIGMDTKTARVLKAIHQNMIFTAVFQLKSKVPMTTMTRDVRTRDGWRINVVFVNNVVCISHRRREQSLAIAPADEQYWFEWELRMVFDQEMTDMQSSGLTITDLGFDDNISARKKEEIKKAFSCGNLIVS